MINILNELNQENGKNYKLNVLKKYKNNQLLQKLLAMTYDKVTYSYGITMKNIKYISEAVYAKSRGLTLLDALEVLEADFTSRNVTGHMARDNLVSLLEHLSKDDAKIIELVLGRDLKIGLGRSLINKVFKDLIVKPPYMRCGVYSDKTMKAISFPAFIQLKADGRYVAVTVDGEEVTFTSRSGEEQEFPKLKSLFSRLPDGVYIGELLVSGEPNRSVANGIINSSEPDHDKIYIQLWDYILLDEYGRSKDKQNKTIYLTRFKTLKNILETTNTADFILMVPSYEVADISEALEYTSLWMSRGLEGGILKDFNNIFLDHTSLTQLKLKVQISIDVRCTGFTEGTAGTSREDTFGAMTFSTDDGMIQGQTSGFTDAQLKEFSKNQQQLIGKVFAVECNDITKGRDNEFYALSHPRFEEFRDDKDDTDTLQRAFELRDMARRLSNGV